MRTFAAGDRRRPTIKWYTVRNFFAISSVRRSYLHLAFNLSLSASDFS